MEQQYWMKKKNSNKTKLFFIIDTNFKEPSMA